MSARVEKLKRRSIRRAFGEPAAALLGAHEEALKDHGEIFRRIVFAGFLGRLRWLLFGVPHGTEAVDTDPREAA